jgi:hypothetical protein
MSLRPPRLELAVSLLVLSLDRCRRLKEQLTTSSRFQKDWEARILPVGHTLDMVYHRDIKCHKPLNYEREKLHILEKLLFYHI